MAAASEREQRRRLLDQCLFASLDQEAERLAWHLEAAQNQRRDSTATPACRRMVHRVCQPAERHLQPHFRREQSWLSRAARWSWQARKLRLERDQAWECRLLKREA